jgi:hypothetical protein
MVCLYKAQLRTPNHFVLFRSGGSLCCGLAFSSRGMVAAGDDALKKLIAVIEEVTLGDDCVVHSRAINSFYELRRIRILLVVSALINRLTDHPAAHNQPRPRHRVRDVALCSTRH